MTLPLSWIGVGGGAVLLAGVIAVQTLRLANAQGERDVARQEIATEQAKHETTRLAFDAEKRGTLAAIDAARRCAIDSGTQISLKNLDIAAKTADAARQRALLKRCSVAVPEILIERGGEMWR